MRLSVFNKNAIVLLALAIPVLLVYGYSHSVSTGVVQQEKISSNANRLSFFLRELNEGLDQLWKIAFVIAEDPDFLELRHVSDFRSDFERLRARKLATEKLMIQSSALVWNNEISVYSPETGVGVSTNPFRPADAEQLLQRGYESWVPEFRSGSAGEQLYFIRHMLHPFLVDGDPSKAGMVVEVAIASGSMSEMLDRFQEGSAGLPFLYTPSHDPITGSGGRSDLIEHAVAALKGTALADRGYSFVSLDGRKYIMNYDKSSALGWYLIDLTPVGDLLAPISNIRNLFYVTIGLLLLLGIISVSFLYRSVQLPIVQLMNGIKRLKRGEYSTRMIAKRNNEFDYLLVQFNLMAEEIQHLIEKVYSERFDRQDAQLKQLQSQINPHFLYNSFAFIQSMAQLDNKKAIVAVTQHLSKYYRYTTRVDLPFAELSEEMALISNYLEIYKMQIHRLIYRIDMPESMGRLVIPRLIVQPIVENAIKYGVEAKEGVGEIRITGSESASAFRIVVEDSGMGMSHTEVADLETSMEETPEGRGSYGLWNIHQRLRRFYGTETGLVFSQSPLGGLLVEINIPKSGRQQDETSKEEVGHAGHFDR
ncbi:sensor histidine kinase [Cohnella herbarum]|uniref:Sensor histidine kinase n=1 Tax=Cohnella herbarum TaxID=2728023 RepID=A0A7Z2ZKR3_9BACL|nr:histidine kinase [Cohnella herbarum]QJD82372.1 sensor histidine kinase [Cohnella herbarum]